MIVFVLFVLIFYKDFKLLSSKDFYRNIKKVLTSQDIIFTYLGTMTLFVYLLSHFKMESKYKIMVYVFLVTSLLLIMVWKYQFNQRFNACFELSQFMIHLSSYFKEEEKIISALDKANSYASASLSNDIFEVSNSLKLYQDKVESFKLLSDHYLLTSMVSMMAYHESHGDQEIAQGLNNLEDDIMDWSNDLRFFKGEIESFTKQIVMVCLLSLLVGIMSQSMLAQTIDIHHSIVYQISIFTFMLAILSILLKSHKILGLDPIFEEEKL